MDLALFFKLKRPRHSRFSGFHFNQGFDSILSDVIGCDVIGDASLAHVTSAGRVEDEDPEMGAGGKRSRSEKIK